MILHSCQQSELRSLEGEGYTCVIVGDMNAHIGQPPLGLEEAVNYNSSELLSFIEANSLFLINRDKDICHGTFSRFSHCSTNILD